MPDCSEETGEPHEDRAGGKLAELGRGREPRQHQVCRAGQDLGQRVAAPSYGHAPHRRARRGLSRRLLRPCRRQVLGSCAVRLVGNPARQNPRRYSRRIAWTPGAIVVSFAGGNPDSPRAQRTARVAQALEDDFGLPRRACAQRRSREQTVLTSRSSTPHRHLARRASAGHCCSRRVRARGPRKAAWLEAVRSRRALDRLALPPICLAAVRLVAAGVPYAVDVGDPWVVTANPGDWGRVWGRFRGRARAAETFLWENAAAGVVTAATQASRLRSLLPDLNLLCRPNGYEAAETGAGGTGIRRAPSDDLRTRFSSGRVYEVRLPIGPWLSRLRQAAGCKTLLFSNYGYHASARAAAVGGSSRGPGIARSGGLAARLRDRPGLRRRPR